MKALTVHPLYAMAIAAGEKTVECRTWSTNYRGPVLICSSAKKLKTTIPGHALAVVDLVDVVEFKPHHVKPAMMERYEPGCYAWILANVRPIKPIPVKGKLSLWNFDEEDKIEILPTPQNEEEDELFGQTYWDPLII